MKAVKLGISSRSQTVLVSIDSIIMIEIKRRGIQIEKGKNKKLVVLTLDFEAKRKTGMAWFIFVYPDMPE